MEIKKWKGLRNTVSPERLTPGELVSASNVDIDDTGKLLTRLGTSRLQTGSFHSLWSDEDITLVMGGVSGNLLYRVADDGSLAQLATFRAPFPVSYAREQRVILMSNGVDTLMLQSGAPRAWGTPAPASQPRLTATAGNLPPGTYMVAITYRRADGFESGSPADADIDIPDKGGISLSSIPSSTDPLVTDIIVYITYPNGTEAFRAAVLPAGTAAWTFSGRVEDLEVAIETSFCTEAPAGTIVEIYNGCAYSVNGDVAYYSDPYALERFRPRTQFVRLPGAITLWAAVNDGIYAATTEATYFLHGGHPREMTSRKVLDYGAIPGTAVKTVAGAVTSLDEAEEGKPGGTAVIWATPFGICFGLEGGRVINMTDREFAIPTGARGRAVMKLSRGYMQYQVSIEGDGDATNEYR